MVIKLFACIILDRDYALIRRSGIRFPKRFPHAHEKDNPLPSALMPQAPSALPDQTRMSDSVRQRLVCKHHNEMLLKFEFKKIYFKQFAFFIAIAVIVIKAI